MLSVLVVPHNDDELIFTSTLLDEIDQVITLTYTAGERRALEQNTCRKIFNFSTIHLGLHDDWLVFPDVEVLERILSFIQRDYAGSRLFVPEVSKLGYYMRAHVILEEWAVKYMGCKSAIQERNKNIKDIFKDVYRSQEHLLEERSEWFSGKKDYFLTGEIK